MRRRRGRRAQTAAASAAVGLSVVSVRSVLARRRLVHPSVRPGSADPPTQRPLHRHRPPRDLEVGGRVLLHERLADEQLHARRDRDGCPPELRLLRRRRRERTRAWRDAASCCRRPRRRCCCQALGCARQGLPPAGRKHGCAVGCFGDGQWAAGNGRFVALVGRGGGGCVVRRWIAGCGSLGEKERDARQKNWRPMGAARPAVLRVSFVHVTTRPARAFPGERDGSACLV